LRLFLFLLVPFWFLVFPYGGSPAGGAFFLSLNKKNQKINLSFSVQGILQRTIFRLPPEGTLFEKLFLRRQPENDALLSPQTKSEGRGS